MARVGGELLDGEPWCRKFLLVAVKTRNAPSESMVREPMSF